MVTNVAFDATNHRHTNNNDNINRYLYIMFMQMHQIWSDGQNNICINFKRRKNGYRSIKVDANV